MSKQVITRFPPSPTGLLHIGSVRTALFNYLYAKQHGGHIYLRFEDTDRERSKSEFEEDIIKGTEWMGMEFERTEVLRQSERTAVYKKHLHKLIEAGSAYEAEESETTAGMKVVRFKNPNKVVVFHDAIRGELSFDTTELGDFVIARTHDLPLYHLAVVIDDAEVGVTHVIRGEDHISNTQRQILLIEALSFTRPEYAHIPLILAPDKSKLSKRHGAVSINEYKAQGFLPEAIINYLALLGWNPGTEQEVFTLEELVKVFSLERVHKAGAVFDIEKLKWFNHEHIKRLTDEEFARRMSEFANRDINPKVISLLKERSQTLLDGQEALAAGEFDFIEEEAPVYSQELLMKGAKVHADAVKINLSKALELLTEASEGFTVEEVKEKIFSYATEVGRAGVLWPMRVALSGKDKSPDPFTLASLIGKEKTLERIEKALKML